MILLMWLVVTILSFEPKFDLSSQIFHLHLEIKLHDSLSHSFLWLVILLVYEEVSRETKQLQLWSLELVF